MQHNKRMYVIGAASIDLALLKKLDVQVPEGTYTGEVIAVDIKLKGV